MTTNEDRTDLLRALGQRVESLASSEVWRAWLDAASRFRQYSFRNQMLLAMQRPDATRVAGYKVWQSLGRQVNKGEHALWILAPCVRKVDDPDTGDRRSVITGFKTVGVFDISQTSGDPLPAITMPAVTIDDGQLYERLVTVAQEHGIMVTTVEDSPSGARGWYRPSERAITIVDGHDTGSRTRTALHEFAHAMDHLDDPTNFELATRAEREIVAESSAYLVGTALGVEMVDASTTYLASWGGQPAAMEQLAQRILKIAAQIEAAIARTDSISVAA